MTLHDYLMFLPAAFRGHYGMGACIAWRLAFGLEVLETCWDEWIGGWMTMHE